MAIIRRMDLQIVRLSKQEFILALQPEEPYSKVMKRSSSKSVPRGVPSFANVRRISDISRYKYKPDELLKFNDNQKDVIRTFAMDRTIKALNESKSPLKSRPFMQNIDDHL